MENTRDKIYLAALLHDIGKFYQRADVESVQNSKYLKDYCKTESTFCPLFNGRYTHKHVLWTAQFIEDNKAVFEKLVNSGLGDLSVADNLINLASGHHLSNEQLSEFGQLIKKADCLSSGMDRSSLEAMKDDQDENEKSWDSFKRKRLVPIMETINQNKSDWHHMPIRKMNLSEDVFPESSFADDPDYNGMWQEFLQEFKFVQSNTYRAFSETLLYLLMKYTSCIPSSTVNFADVSLFDHLKTTAAIAVCLYDYEHSEDQNKSDSPFLLIGADMSGIQSYIYQTVSKYAGKNLKGRSLYLRLLSDAIVRYLLKQLNLYQANVIYNSGGGFYILAPNTSTVKTKLTESVKYIEDSLFQEHGISLHVAVDSVELSEDAMMHRGDNLGKVWGRLFELRDRKKMSKFSSLMAENYETFFEPSFRGGDAERDSVTGEEFLKGEFKEKMGGLLLKQVTAKQIEIGKKLRDTEVIVIKEGSSLSYWNDKPHINPALMGFTYYFLNYSDIKEMKEKLRGSADKVTVLTLNGKNGNCEFMHKLDGINNIYGLEFYGGNEMKDVLTFEEMCENEDKDSNFSRLGVLRMDVDGLGSIFQNGIPKERATLSRYAALSRAMDLFFSGYLNTIWRETDPQKSFIIYSGGDDVFIVGNWDVTIDLAEKIRNDFSRYSGDNPCFTLSAGLSLVTSKYPIMKGAELSADAESAAKNHTCQGSVKDSICFLGMPLNWHKEFLQVKKLKNVILELLQKGILDKSFISKIMQHTANAHMDKHKVTSMKTFWMLTYDLGRMKERIKNKEVEELLDSCIKEVCNKSCGTLHGEPVQSDYHPLELWCLAARWAEFAYRQDN